MDRYEEALERAKKGLPIDEVFPELKESEDERIRKELLEEIEFIIPHDDETDSEGLILPSYHARIDRYKSYLEKQKEQKPECDNETEVQKTYREGKNAGRKEVLDHPEYYGLKLRRMYDYETGERNPEWSDEDTEMYINVASSLRGYACGLENEEHKRHIKKELDWLENRFQSLRPSWKPSEEQIRTLDIVISDYRHACTKDSDKKAETLKPLLEQLEKL